MNKSAIVDELKAKYGSFTKFVAGLSEADFMFSLNGEKWTAGQQVDHLCRSVEPLNRGLKMPSLALKAMFGTADHPSASYDEIVAQYRGKLAAGGAATPPFMPEAIAFDRRDEMLKQLGSLVNELREIIGKLDESKLDELVLPHPLLGKLTLREMFYFTMYHAEHHHVLSEKNLASKVSS